MQDRKESAQKYLQGSRGIGYVEQNMVPQEKQRVLVPQIWVKFYTQ